MTMKEIKIILEDFKIRENLIRLKYESKIPPFSPLYCTDRCKIDEQQKQIKYLAEQASKELEEIAKEKNKALREYYKKQDERVSNMTDRQLLEEVYRGMLKEQTND